MSIEVLSLGPSSLLLLLMLDEICEKGTVLLFFVFLCMEDQ